MPSGGRKSLLMELGECTYSIRAGKENVNADALSRSPHAPAALVGDVQEDVQVAVIDISPIPATGDTCHTDISSLYYLLTL